MSCSANLPKAASCILRHRIHVVLQQWGRVPALNTNATFIDDLAAMVLEKLPSAAPRPGYVPSLNETMNLGPPTGTLSAPAAAPLPYV